jgi:hypothetical protein
VEGVGRVEAVPVRGKHGPEDGRGDAAVHREDLTLPEHAEAEADVPGRDLRALGPGDIERHVVAERDRAEEGQHEVVRLPLGGEETVRPDP